MKRIKIDLIEIERQVESFTHQEIIDNYFSKN